MNLKKILTPLLLIVCLQGLFAQTLLSTQSLELKKPRDSQEILAAPEANNRGLTVFAADKNTVTALHYTRALFYKDSLVAPRPDSDYEFMAGYSYTPDGSPQVYWASADYTKIQAVRYNFDDKTTADYFFEIPFKDEHLLTTFSNNNAFYMVTRIEKEDKLKFYEFTNDKYEAHTVDFSGYKFTDEDNVPTNFRRLLQDYPLQKIDSTAFNTMPNAVAKIKMYTAGSNILLTLDHNTGYTQLFTISTDTYAVTEKQVKQVVINDALTNSFYHSQRLYQLVLNEEQVSLSATDVATGEVIQQYKAGANDTITFKNSPLREQSGNKRPNEFKNTKRFLRRAASGDAAIAVYQTPNDLMVISGVLRNTVSAENVMLGIAVGGMMVAGGYAGDMSGLFDSENTESVYFESLFDQDFKHKPLPQQRLAADYLAQFINTHENMSLQTVFRFNYYFVLGYYDAKEKHFVLRKFEDDFVH